MKKLSQFLISSLTTLLVLAILVVIVAIADSTAARLDLSRKGYYSLSEESAAFLRDMGTPVDILYVTQVGQENLSVFTLLQEYDAYDTVNLRTVDPVRDIGTLQRLAALDARSAAEDIRQGTVIVTDSKAAVIIPAAELYGISYTEAGTAEPYSFQAEEMISNAILSLSGSTEPTIYQITGHREYTYKMLGIEELLDTLRYSTAEINLLEAGYIPEDADLLSIISPEDDFKDAELRMLQAYLDQGGAIFMALDLREGNHPNLERLLDRMNVAVVPGFVMEQDPSRLIAAYGNAPIAFTPITADQELITVEEEPILIQTMGFQQKNSLITSSSYTAILQSSTSSWLRTDLNNTNDRRISSDVPGPIDIAVIAEDTDTKARIALIGSGNSLGELPGFGSYAPNTTFVSKLIDELVPGKEVLNIPSKGLISLPLNIPGSSSYMYAILVIILIPGIILTTGLLVYRRRRQR